MKKAVFIDKDGTLIADVPFNVDPDLIRLKENVIYGLKALLAQDFLLIVITNQPGIAFGYFSEYEFFHACHHLDILLLKEGISLNGFYYCPHSLEGTIPVFTGQCRCRKPGTGLFEQAAKDFDIDLASSWMIGDIETDIDAGHNAGCKAILVPQTNIRLMNEPERPPEYIAASVDDAARFIIETCCRIQSNEENGA